MTEIEHWLRDPYTIYAKHILKLPRLDPVDDRPGAAERGSIIHRAIGDFAKAHADALPDDPYGELLHFGERHFAPLKDYPEARAFWWPRYERIARWFADFETRRRANMAAAHAEIRGELSIEAGDRVFRLVGRADRIERLADGGYAILDFKTGTPPTSPQVQSCATRCASRQTVRGKSVTIYECRPPWHPDLTDWSELKVAQLRHNPEEGEWTLYWADRNGRWHLYDTIGHFDPARRAFVLGSWMGDGTVRLERFKALVTSFEDESTPYHALVLSMWKNRYGAYDDLARVKEWSLSGAEVEEE